MRVNSISSILISVVLSTSVNAAIISTDYKSTGDNLITYDTVNRLNWLDLTETNGLSYNYVSEQLKTEGKFEGWRYATNTEVATFWGNFGVDLTAESPYPARYQYFDPQVRVAADYLGNIINEFDGSLGYGVMGMTSSISPINPNQLERMGAYVDSAFTYYLYIGRPDYQDKNYSALHTGSFLVAPAAVPIPAAAYLFGSGLIGLVGLARRKISFKAKSI